MSKNVRRTSKEAYKNLIEDGVLTQRRAEVYDCLYHHGPLTGAELSKIESRKNVGANSNAITRLGELRDQGVVYEVTDNHECSITKKHVILWDVTEKVHPNDLPKKQTKQTRIADLNRKIQNSIESIKNRDRDVMSKESVIKLLKQIKEKIKEI